MATQSDTARRRMSWPKSSSCIALGVRDIHMYADLFTVNREHVVGICEGILQRGWKLRWTCNSRVDFVDAELLKLMARAGCWMISWGIESGDEAMLKRMHKGITHAQVDQALRWAKEAHIMNWGYFIIGLPGETEESIRKTIDLCQAACPSTWSSFISPRPIRARRSSSKWWNKAGSGPARAGKRWTWIAPPCWTIPT